MKSFTLFIVLLLCMTVEAQTQINSQADFNALEAKYEKFVNEGDSPQKEEFIKQLSTLRDSMMNKQGTMIRTQSSFTESEEKELGQMDVYIGYLDRWLMFLQKDKIRQWSEFKELWAKLKPLRQQNSPDLYKVQSELFDKACKELEHLPDAERKKRSWEIYAIFNLLNTLPEEPEP